LGLFDKPEVTILKDSNAAKDYLAKLEALLTETNDKNLADKLEKEIAITKAGIAGEDAIMFELRNSGMDLVVLHDLYIETEDGKGAQIDFIVITPYANVFIECKNMFGNITIDNHGNFIREFSYGRHKVKEGIYNPVTQNERHMTIIKECRAAQKGAIMSALYRKNFDTYNKSLVVLANPKTVLYDRYAPKSVKSQVIRGDQLVSVLKGIKTDVKSKKSEMISFGENLLRLNKDNRTDYFEKFENMKAETSNEPEQKQIGESEGTKLICPRCGRELVLRTSTKGENAGEPFYGCSGFPKCWYTQKP